MKLDVNKVRFIDISSGVSGLQKRLDSNIQINCQLLNQRFLTKAFIFMGQGVS